MKRYKSIAKTALRLTLIIMAVAFMAGCSSHKQGAVSEKNKHYKADAATLASTYAPWETFYAPFSLRAVEPASMSLSGRATFVRDRYIHLSMRMMGFEVAVVYIDNDSVLVADKYHKITASAPLTSVTSRTGLTLGNLQDILMGRGFFPGMGTLCSIENPEALFSISETNGMSVFIPRRIPDGFSWFFTVDGTLALQSLTVEPDGMPVFTVTYSDISDTPAGAVGADVSLNGEIGDKTLEANLRWNLGKARWNEAISDPEITFRGYRHINVDELMQVLRQM